MNQEKLLYIAKNPSDISATDARELEELTRKFPYFSMPFVLLTRYYSDQSDYRLEETLLKTALRVKDRSWLYDFVHPAAKPVEILDEVQTAAPSETIVPDQIEEAESLPEEILESVTEAESTPEINDLLAEITPEEQTMSELLTQAESWVEPDTITEAKESEEDEVFEEIGSFDSAIVDENEDEAEDVTTQDTSGSMIEPDIEDHHPEPKPIEKRKPLGHVGASVYNIEDYFENREAEKGNDFFSWLSHPGADALESLEPEKPKEENKKLDLIEKFIQNKPSVSRPKSEFFNAHEVAKKSEILPDALVTETLANVYIGQENYVGALKIYEKLLLKNPQKRPYFAALIEKIKKEHNL